jgi:hypothetical protein
MDSAKYEYGGYAFDPRRSNLSGSVTKSKLRLTALIYSVLFLSGIAGAVVGLPPMLKTALIGLWFPGAGFLSVGGWSALYIIPTLVLFAIALVLWFASGNVLAPLTVWGGSLLISVLQTGTQTSAFGTFFAILVVCLVFFKIKANSAKSKEEVIRKRDLRNAYLPSVLQEIEDSAVPAQSIENRELSEQQLASLRYILDRALQSPGKFKGFDIIEQFQPSALRYQLNHLCYTMAISQCQYTPSFHGYLNEAQRNCIDQLTLPKVWKYWKLESHWGHLQADYNPAGKDNIMLTGWSGMCMNTYTANTGDMHYAQEGSLTFALPHGKSYEHDAHTFVKSIVDNFKLSPYFIYPCEPNWIYALCNMYGINTIASYDTAFNTSYTEKVKDDFIKNWEEEMMLPDGSIHPFRSKWTGIAMPASDGIMNIGSVALMAAPVFPKLARRLYSILRKEKFVQNGRGKLEAVIEGSALLDPGNYKMTGAWSAAYMACIAADFGDVTIKNSCLDFANENLKPKLENGVFSYEKASNFSNAMFAQAIISQKNDWTDTITKGPVKSSLSGPILVGLTYPDVLVARAFSSGHDLDIILYPGLKPEGEFNIGLERLVPNASYSIQQTAQQFVADAAGCATVTVKLSGRTPLLIVPSQNQLAAK